MGFGQAVASGFSNYVNFSGRAPRSEYWFWVLFTIIGGIATGIVDAFAFPEASMSPLNSLFNLACFLPSLAIGVRRLHDIDRTGWWLLILLTLIGVILLIIWACIRGTIGPNRFGPDPLAGQH
jgi:uncharacterized membrane protein YhaH (DUF805 family)